MRHQIELGREARADERVSDGVHEVAPDIAYQRLAIVNVVYCGRPGAGDRRWLLIDAGMMGSANAIRSAAARRFGREARPYAIILTHGHFDHVGALRTLAEEWDVTVYAHPAEMPFLTGQQSYPPPDPWAGGMMSLLSPLMPRGPIDVREFAAIAPLDRGGSLPGMPGWEFIPTPGHTPGHISLWRSRDRAMITGDAFITTRQESAYSAATQHPEMHGPPAYFTPDWQTAKRSVRRLAELEPDLVVTGHGRAMSGPAMREALFQLARKFDEVAVPRHRDERPSGARG